MKPLIVNVDAYRKPILSSDGFAKKLLADDHLDLLSLCQYGCLFCSSTFGHNLKFHKQTFGTAINEQLGRPLQPGDDPRLMLMVNNIIENLERQLEHKPADFGRGKTVVFSMLTDGFSPELLKNGSTRKALDLLVERTKYLIRILTKNPIVGSPPWPEYFAKHKDRFTVGLSTGTLDDEWARRIEVGTPSPSRRIKALHALQDAGVPTYGMLCPVCPHMLVGDQLERLFDAIRPDRVQHIWWEPYNDRKNWKMVVQGLEPGSIDHRYLLQIYGQGNYKLWSKYATNLYSRLKKKAEDGGYLPKLRYLLYEGQIDKTDAYQFAGLEGVLVQGKPGADGLSKNPHIAALQTAAGVRSRS